MLQPRRHCQAVHPYASTKAPVLGGSAGARRGGSTAVVGVSFVVALVVATGGGIYLWTQSNGDSNSTNALLHTVKKGDFELSVTERGEIEGFDVTEVRSLVKSNNSAGIAILRIVPEGTEVAAGDFLVELDSAALVSEGTLQKISVNTSNAGRIEAKSLYETAQIAAREYVEGTYKQERQAIEGELFVAEENLNRARDFYAYSQKLAAKGYVNELQLEADRFAVEKANKDLDTANTKLMVLDEYTKPKMQNQLEGAVLIAQAKWEAAKNSYELELEKLKEIEDQIVKCTIVAPQAGVVKYAHETDRRGDQEFVVEEGAVIRERQAIILLPNADSLQVKLMINESLIQYVRAGMPASIAPVGVGDRVLRGRVQKVNQYPEPGGWRRANVKEYVAFVSVDETVPELKSGLTASVTIQCSRLSGVLQVPVQAIYAHGDKMYCLVHDANGWEARQVTPGPTNDKFFVIESGLNDGDRVAMNPRGYVDQVKLPELSPEERQRAVQRGPQNSLDEEGMGEDGPSIQGGPPMGGQGGRRGRRGAGGAGGPGQRSAGLTEPNAPVDENVEPAAQQSAGATQ